MQGTSRAEMVTTRQRLESVVESALEQPRVAVDLESNGFYHYPERVCLVQLAAGDDVYIIDPLSIEDPAPLGELLAASAVEKIFHSADYDIRSLDRDWGFHVRGLFDTSIAAAFTGSERLGLASVLKERLGIEIPKSKRLQRADWTRRPLSGDLLRYAAEDVRHLERLRTLLHDKLDRLGRTGWVKEEIDRLAAVRYSAPDPKWAFLSTKGSRDLNGRGLAVLRSLHKFRDKEARRRDRPPFKVFSDAVMVAIAASPQSDLALVKSIGRYGHGSDSKRLRRAVREGIKAAPVRRPKTPTEGGGRPTPAAGKRLRLLKGWRNEHAARLKLDPALVWPAASLGRIAARPAPLADELECPEVRQWQRREFEESLLAFVRENLEDDRAIAS